MQARYYIGKLEVRTWRIGKSATENNLWLQEVRTWRIGNFLFINPDTVYRQIAFRASRLVYRHIGKLRFVPHA